MRATIRRHGTTIIVAMITAAVTAGAPAIAHVTSSWLHLRNQHVRPWADGRYAKKTPPPYVVQAGPSAKGVVQRLSNARMDALCRDQDGCEVTLAMVNWDSLQPGNVASRHYPLFISQSSRFWRFGDVDVSGLDDSTVIQEVTAFDCYLTDAETSLNAMNDRADIEVGWGLLNLYGGGFDDATTACRVIVKD